jgi:hypothetical protein
MKKRGKTVGEQFGDFIKVALSINMKRVKRKSKTQKKGKLKA